MKTTLGLLCGALLTLSPVSVCAQPAPIPTAKIDADMRAAMKRNHMPGMTIAILRAGVVVYEHAYGFRDVARRLPATLTTHYEIGSITKQFTAAAVMQLVDAGKISLNAKLSTYLPNAPHASAVTIRELLSHTSGEPDYTDGKDLVAAVAHPAGFGRLMARIAGKPLLFAPGTNWSYSNTNYILLGRVIEVTSGESYERYLFEHVLSRAPGANFATIRNENELPQMARGYEGGKVAPPLDNSWAWSAGNLVGTVGDMLAWDAALMNGKVVPAANYAAMTAVQTPPAAAKTPYGFGLMLDPYDGQPRIWHDGGTLGFSCSDQFYPNERTRIIVFTNGIGGDVGVPERIFDDLYPELRTRKSST